MTRDEFDRASRETVLWVEVLDPALAKIGLERGTPGSNSDDEYFHARPVRKSGGQGWGTRGFRFPPALAKRWLERSTLEKGVPPLKRLVEIRTARTLA